MKIRNENLIDLISLIAKVSYQTGDLAYDQAKNQTREIVNTSSLVVALADYLSDLDGADEFDKDKFIAATANLVKIKTSLSPDI